MNPQKKIILVNLNNTAKKICEAFVEIDNVVGVAIGGSLAREFSDEISDIEMYVYYNETLPSDEKIKNILSELNAMLTRSKKIFWYHEAWGYHTFFKVNNIKIELGYRDIQKTSSRINDFVKVFSLPKHGIHDTPFGHYESGFASCIKECNVLYDKYGELKELKKIIDIFPEELKIKTINYYFKDVKNITNNKIKQAVARNDTYNFNACVSRVIRSFSICLFAINDTYFPGDKWSHKYIDRFKKKPESYDKMMGALLDRGDFSEKDKAYKYAILRNMITRMQKLIKNK